MATGAKYLLALSLMSGVASCAGQVGDARQSHILASGGEVAAPAGLMDYCLREAQECSGALTASLRGTLPATGAAGANYVPQAFDSAEPRLASTAVFRALLTARLAPSAATEPVRVEMTPERWRALRRLNRHFNRSIRGGTDRDIYGVEERWARPLGEGADSFSPRGDCEDYALEKRAALIDLGYPAESLAMAIAVVPGVGLHAVLVVQTDEGDLVLDNLHDRVRSVSHRDYGWISRQIGPDIDRWSSARVEGRSALSPAQMLEAMPQAEPTSQFHARLEAARAQARAAAARPAIKSIERTTQDRDAAV
jgi:predicted transglutaminase-like cysteine proteinase